MGVFAGIQDARETAGGNYLKPGVYDVEVMRLSKGETRKGVAFFAADLRVLGSNNAEHPIGQVVNWFVGFDKEPALGNVKNFAVAVLSVVGTVDPTTITEQVMEQMVDKGGEGVRGVRLRVQVNLVDTKGGNKFSRHLWFPAGTQIQATSAA